MKKIRYLSLCAGIGGLDLGFDRAGMECVGQVEIDPYCRRVLAKHWPDVWRHDDVTTCTGDLIETHCGAVDLIAAGFPCQDLSVAGKQAGIHDGERSSLFFDIMRLVRVVRPRYVVLENVPALLARPEWMGAVLGELAASGFDAWWDCLPAGAFGAHFLGDRVFVVAESAEAGGLRWQRRQPTAAASWGQQQLEGLVRAAVESGVPAGSLGRVSDGVRHRTHRLRGLGNAVVPQVAEHLGRLIVDRHARIESGVAA